MHQLQTAPDSDQQVAFGPVLVGRAGQEPVGAVVADHALAAAEAGDRRLDQLGERGHLFRGVLRAGADHDQRVARLADQPGDFRDPVGIRQRRRRNGPVDVEIDPRGLSEHVPRRLDRRRSDASFVHPPERLRHRPGRFGGVVDPFGPAGEAAQGGELVRQFVELAPAAPDQVGHDVAGHAQQRRVGAVCDAERGGRVEHARAGNDGVDAGPAGRLGVAVGQVAGALLVSRGDEPDAVALARERVGEVVHVGARNAENGVHAVQQERLRDRLAGGQSRKFVHALPFQIHLPKTTVARGRDRSFARRRRTPAKARFPRGSSRRRRTGPAR